MNESAKPMTLRRRVQHGLLPLIGRGIDVGAGGPGHPDREWWTRYPAMKGRAWDRAAGDGDATELFGVDNESQDWIYSSHLLEHLVDPTQALLRWCQVVRPGGQMLLSVPHRDLYECKLNMPSQWSCEHLRFYAPFDKNESTVPLIPWLQATLPRNWRIVYWEVGNWEYQPPRNGQQAQGEYCIDVLMEREY